jgi:nitrous oxidase accessory protein NosD
MGLIAGCPGAEESPDAGLAEDASLTTTDAALDAPGLDAFGADAFALDAPGADATLTDLDAPGLDALGADARGPDARRPPADVGTDTHEHLGHRITDFGAISGDGLDDTAAFVAAFAAGNEAFVPAGVFNVTRVVVPEGARLSGDEAGFVDLDPATSGAGISLGARTTMFGMTIRGSRARRHCIAATGVANVLIDTVRLVDCGSDGLGGGGDEVRFGIHFDHVTMSRIARSIATGTRGRAIEIDFSSDIRINDNIIVGGQHGIEYWGLDTAAPDLRQALRITMTGNQVRDIEGGCIWGAAGDTIVMDRNDVANCGDVGLDVENTLHATITNNRVGASLNGGITTFYASRDVRIEDNVIDQSMGLLRGPGIQLKGTGTTSNVLIQRNTVTTRDFPALGTDSASTETMTAPPDASDVLVSNNVFQSYGDVPTVRILDAPRFTFMNNEIRGEGLSGISLEGCDDARVENNRITGTARVVPIGAYGGVFVYTHLPGYLSRRAVVQGNTITGYAFSIHEDAWRDAASGSLFTNNIVETLRARSLPGYTGMFTSNFSDAARTVPVAPVFY